MVFFRRRRLPMRFASRRPVFKRRSSAVSRPMRKAIRKVVKNTVAASEKKVHRLYGEWAASYDNTTTTISSLCEIAQGQTNATRLGNRARITGIYMKLRCYVNSEDDTTDAPISIRFGIDAVKQGVYDTTTPITARPFLGSNSVPDYVNKTKRVILDKTLVPPQANDGDLIGNYRTFTKFIRLRNHECRWDTTSAQDPETGNLLAWIACDSSNALKTVRVDADFHVYFSEV